VEIMSDIRKHDTAAGAYDFGDDDNIPPPDDPAFDAWLAKVAPAVNVPPVTPRMEMWDAIQKAQTGTVPASVPIVSITSRRRTNWIWPTAIAAALLVGVGIDRYMLSSSTNVQVATVPPGTTAGAPGAPSNAYADSTPSRLYRVAAVQTLTQAEALLTAYRSTDMATKNPAAAKQLGQWGREVLSSTRLLLDSPAGDDPQLRALLDDIELVLVQIIRLSGSPPDSTERALIDGAMREHDLLPRIRTVVPAGNAGATD
jgi:hypothetical protein